MNTKGMKALCVKCGEIPESKVERYDNRLKPFRHIGCGQNVTFVIRQDEDEDVAELTGEPQVGPELDLAVAKAIGLKTAVFYDCEGKVLITSREWDEIRGIEHTTCEGGVACVPFQPSVDLNTAFAVAGRAFVAFRLQYRGPGRYEFECPFPGDDGWSRWGEHSTPAPAICAAILKLKEGTK